MKTWAESRAEHVRTYWTELHKACDGCTAAMARAAGVSPREVCRFKRTLGLAPSAYRASRGAMVLGPDGLSMAPPAPRPRRLVPLPAGGSALVEGDNVIVVYSAPVPADATPEGAGS